jgi:hypothetical protein
MNNRPLTAGTTNAHSIRTEKDFHCFDIAGVPDPANIEQCTIDIFFPNKPISNISNIPMDLQLLGTQAPGNSQFLFPFLLQKGEVATITIVNPTLADFDFDLSLFGYHRDIGLPLGGCPPDKLVYYYILDFGTVNAGIVGARQRVRINSNFDFVALGTIATAEAAAPGVLEFKFEIDSRSEVWMRDYVRGNALFQNVLATPRRIFWRIPQVFRSMEEISLYCGNPTLANQANTEVAIFGYHIPKGLSEGQIRQDFEGWQNVNWQ